MENLNVNEIIRDLYCPSYQNKCEEIKQNNILTIVELSPFSNSLEKKLKELFDLIISKISSDGGDFRRIIEIALFRLNSIA